MRKHREPVLGAHSAGHSYRISGVSPISAFLLLALVQFVKPSAVVTTYPILAYASGGRTLTLCRGTKFLAKVQLPTSVDSVQAIPKWNGFACLDGRQGQVYAVSPSGAKAVGAKWKAGHGFSGSMACIAFDASGRAGYVQDDSTLSLWSFSLEKGVQKLVFDARRVVGRLGPPASWVHDGEYARIAISPDARGVAFCLPTRHMVSKRFAASTYVLDVRDRSLSKVAPGTPIGWTNGNLVLFTPPGSIEIRTIAGRLLARRSPIYAAALDQAGEVIAIPGKRESPFVQAGPIALVLDDKLRIIRREKLASSNVDCMFAAL